MDCWFEEGWWEGFVHVTRDDSVDIFFPGNDDTVTVREDQSDVPKEAERYRLRRVPASMQPFHPNSYHHRLVVTCMHEPACMRGHPMHQLLLIGAAWPFCGWAVSCNWQEKMPKQAAACVGGPGRAGSGTTKGRTGSQCPRGYFGAAGMSARAGQTPCHPLGSPCPRRGPLAHVCADDALHKARWHGRHVVKPGKGIKDMHT